LLMLQGTAEIIKNLLILQNRTIPQDQNAGPL
jgi:TRAP-type mannitol/chloroaromatic compound transport system permease small subunit